MIKIKKSILLPALSKVAKVINGRSRNEVLKNVRIIGADNQLQLAATNGEQQTVLSVACETNESLYAVVNAKAVEQIVRKFNRNDTISIETNEKSITFKTDRLSFNIGAFLENNFRVLADTENWSCEFSIDRAIVERINKQLLFAAGTDESRFYLNGIHLHSDEWNNRLLIAVATDAKRLAKVAIDIDQEINLAPVTVPSEFWKLTKGFFDEKQPIEVSVSQTFIRMEQGKREVISKLIDMRYPYYQNVIPRENNDYFYVDRQALIDKINEVTVVFDDKKITPISFTFAADKVTLEACNSEIGSLTAQTASAEVRVIASGNPEKSITTRFNGKLLLDILTASDADDMVFRLDAQSPCGAAIIRPSYLEEKVFLGTVFLLMPYQN
ncbi:DNA polymerase III subunit beta [Bartonella apis]|uniref:DNA polymerase III subunit beta n=1 Tax=Bartonella apis TaxID=1686310 RepID=UPI00242EB429|nr:DNA polymerase III subunit beta [Bartonella apis]